jgi:hypothetical protein
LHGEDEQDGYNHPEVQRMWRCYKMGSQSQVTQLKRVKPSNIGHCVVARMHQIQGHPLFAEKPYVHNHVDDAVAQALVLADRYKGEVFGVYGFLNQHQIVEDVMVDRPFGQTKVFTGQPVVPDKATHQFTFRDSMTNMRGIPPDDAPLVAIYEKLRAQAAKCKTCGGLDAKVEFNGLNVRMVCPCPKCAACDGEGGHEKELSSTNGTWVPCPECQKDQT